MSILFITYSCLTLIMSDYTTGASLGSMFKKNGALHILFHAKCPVSSPNALIWVFSPLAPVFVLNIVSRTDNGCVIGDRFRKCCVCMVCRCVQGTSATDPYVRKHFRHIFCSSALFVKVYEELKTWEKFMQFKLSFHGARKLISPTLLPIILYDIYPEISGPGGFDGGKLCIPDSERPSIPYS